LHSGGDVLDQDGSARPAPRPPGGSVRLHHQALLAGGSAAARAAHLRFARDKGAGVKPGIDPGTARLADETRRLRTGFLRLKSALFDPVTSLYSYNVHLEGRLAAATWAPTPPAIDCSVGYSLVCPNPSARFERMVHQGIREARGMTLRDADRVQVRRAAELRTIMDEGLLTTHYQPIVDMDLGTIMGY